MVSAESFECCGGIIIPILQTRKLSLISPGSHCQEVAGLGFPQCPGTSYLGKLETTGPSEEGMHIGWDPSFDLL